MSLDDLYAELELDFKPEERSLFLSEISSAARSHRSELGGEGAEQDEISRQIESLAARLDSETAVFSPVLDIMPLRRQEFQKRGLTVPLPLAERMRRYKFYLVNVPITLVPMPGWGFIQLDCILEFNPDQPTAKRPLTYQVFPEQKWESIIKASQGLQVGIDENFEFNLPMDVMPGVAQAEVGLKAGGKARLVLGPFNYNIRRPKVVSRGYGNVFAHWRLEGEETFEQEDPKLGLILQMPKDLKEVTILGVLKASRRFHPFTAHVRHLMQYVRSRTKKFVDQGAPLVDDQKWDISKQL